MRRLSVSVGVSLLLVFGLAASAWAESCFLFCLAPQPRIVVATAPAPAPAPVAAQVAAPAPAPALVAPPAPAPESNESLEARMLDLLNAERAAAGLPLLALESWAQSAARGQSERMAAAMDLWHNMVYMKTGRGAMGATLLGENVAMATTVEAAMNLLMNSDGHRRNILDSRFTHVGIGIARADGFVFATQDFARKGGKVKKAVKRRVRRTRRR